MKSLRFALPFLLVATTLTSFAASVKAENWFFLLDDESNIKHFLDRASIKRKGNTVEVKAFQVSSKVDSDGSIAAIATFEIACRDRKFRTTEESVLFEDRSTRVFKQASAWEPIKKETVADFMLQEVCKTK